MSLYKIVKKKGKRYIVQKSTALVPMGVIYEDLAEFTNLEEARKFKRNLELDDGIEIE